MTTEELKVRVSLDTSGLKTDINRAKQSLKDLNKETKVNMGDGAAKTNEEMKNLSETLEQIRNLNFADVLIDSLDRVRGTTIVATDSVREAIGHTQNAIGSLFSSEAKGGRMKSFFINIREGFDSIRGGIQSTKKNVIELWDEMTFGAGKAVIVLGAVLAAIAAIKSALNTGLQNAQLTWAAERVGLTAQAYQQWAYVLQQTGGEVDSLSDFIKTLSDVQNQVREGTEEMVAIYKRLGMSVEEVSNMDQSTMFARTIEALQNVTNEVERTSLAYKIFGEDDAAKVATILNMTNAETAALINNYQYLGATMSNSLIERSQKLQGAVTNLSTAWQGLKNTLSHAVMPAITWVVNALTKAIAVVNMFLKVVLGIDLSPSASKINQVAGGYGDYTGAANKAAGATDGVTKAIQRLKRVTMGFDELNKLPGEDDVDSGGGTGLGIEDYVPSGGFSGGGLDIPSVEDLGLGKWQDFFEKYKTLIQDIVTWSLIGIGGVGAVLCLLGGNWVGALKFAALAAIGFGVGSVEGGTFSRLSSGYNNTILNLTAVSLVGIGLVGAVLCLLGGNWLGALKFAAMAGVGFAVGSVEGGVFNQLFQNLKTFWGEVKTWFSTNIKPIFTKEYWAKKWEAVTEQARLQLLLIKTIFVNGWEAVKNWFNETVKPVFTKKYWETKFAAIKDGANTKLTEAKTAITTKWADIKKWFSTEIAPKFTKEYWSNKFDTIRSGAASKLDSAISTIKTKWDGIKSWFNSSVAPKFTTSYWKGKFDTISSGAKSAFNGVIAIVEKAVNRIISKINTLSWKIPNWVPGVGGSKFGFNFSQISIPRLATGGIAVNDTLAHIGEDGYREAVLPLDRNTEWMDTLADKIAARSGGQAPSKIILTIDGKELGRATINNINSITKQTGSLPLVLV